MSQSLFTSLKLDLKEDCDRGLTTLKINPKLPWKTSLIASLCSWLEGFLINMDLISKEYIHSEWWISCEAKKAGCVYGGDHINIKFMWSTSCILAAILSVVKHKCPSKSCWGDFFFYQMAKQSSLYVLNYNNNK